MRRVGQAILVLVVAALLVVVQAEARARSAPRHLASAEGLAERVLQALNELRRSNGLAPLRANAALDAAAQQHGTEMVEEGYFSHDSADGTPYWRRIERFYRPSANAGRWTVGENLFWSSPTMTAAQAIRVWMASPHHRENLLHAAWRDVGVSAIRASAVPGVFDGLSVTVLTVDFGAR